MPLHAAEPLTDALLTVKDLSEILDMGERTIWRLESEGILPKAIRINKRLVRWKASSIQAYLDAKEKEPKD